MRFLRRLAQPPPPLSQLSEATLGWTAFPKMPYAILAGPSEGINKPLDPKIILLEMPSFSSKPPGGGAEQSLAGFYIAGGGFLCRCLKESVCKSHCTCCLYLKIFIEDP